MTELVQEKAGADCDASNEDVKQQLGRGPAMWVDDQAKGDTNDEPSLKQAVLLDDAELKHRT